jgi:hypothetical protein
MTARACAVGQLDYASAPTVSPYNSAIAANVEALPLAISLDDNATVAQAEALMAGEVIVSDRRLVGIVSTMDRRHP